MFDDAEVTLNGLPATLTNFVVQVDKHRTPDELIAVLDERGRSVDLYRTLDDGWRVRVIEPGADRTVAGATIQAALEAAVALRAPLPRHPRPPRHRSWEIVKDGSTWRLDCSDGSTSRWPTKKAAQARQAVYQQWHETACREWIRDFNHLTVGGHGETWLWIDDPQEMG